MVRSRFKSDNLLPRQRIAINWLRLVGWLGVITLTWCVALPWIGRHPAIARHIEHQEKQGIDPSAMFYSELEIVPSIAHRIERLQEARREAFFGRLGAPRPWQRPLEHGGALRKQSRGDWTPIELFRSQVAAWPLPVRDDAFDLLSILMVA